MSNKMIYECALFALCQLVLFGVLLPILFSAKSYVALVVACLFLLINIFYVKRFVNFVRKS